MSTNEQQHFSSSEQVVERQQYPTRKKRQKKRRQSIIEQTLSVQTNIYEKPSYLVIEPSSVFLPYKRESTQTNTKKNSNKSLLTLEVIGENNTPKNEKTYARQNVLKSLTVGIILKYKLCSSDFKYTNPKLVLTKPSTPVENRGKDNVDGNLILTVDDMLNDRYCVKDVLGQGTFGQVARCEDTKEGCKQVAVKIIKNKRAYLKQAEVETAMLETVSTFI